VIVDLHEIHARDFHASQRFLHLADAGFTAVVQTLVGHEHRPVMPSSAARSPTTDSDGPYIGELSISLPALLLEQVAEFLDRPPLRAPAAESKL